MSNVCPCCGRKIIAKKSSAPKIDKRLEQDIARANAALAALATAESRWRLRDEPTPSPEAIASLRHAIESESKRMTRALTDHRLLWSIYRRADKSAPYWQAAEPVAAEPQTVTAQLEPEAVAA
jgi:hypothetical protein